MSTISATPVVGSDDDGTLAKRAVMRISAIEFWERYSFYNMFALLSLFVATPVAKGGMGWSGGDALRFFGTYLLTVQLAPLIGGYMIDRWISARLSLRIGVAGLVIGHSLLAVSAFLPTLGGGALAAWATSTRHSLGWVGAVPGIPAALALPYMATTFAFYGAVAFVAIGNGLFKPILTAVVGRLPHASPVEREAAFTNYFLFINIGGLMSTLLGGWLAQAYGWAWAFGAAASGMVVAFATTAVVSKRYIQPFLTVDIGEQARRAEATAEERPFLIPLLLMLGLILAISVCGYQSYGFVSLFTDRLVDRHFAGITIPPAWFTALNPITIMVLTPVFLHLWRTGGLGHDWSVTDKIAGGFAMIAAAFAALVIASIQAQGGALASPVPVLIAIALIAGSELIVTPAAMSAITRLTPPRLQTFALGAYGAAVGVGAWLSGRVGALAIEANTTVILAIVAGVSLAAVVAIILLRKYFRRIEI